MCQYPPFKESLLFFFIFWGIIGLVCRKKSIVVGIHLIQTSINSFKYIVHLFAKLHLLSRQFQYFQ